jgi:hypothetical protein
VSDDIVARLEDGFGSAAGRTAQVTAYHKLCLAAAAEIMGLRAALAKREAAAEEISAEMYIVGGETFFDCAKQYGISGSTENDQNAAARIYRAMLSASQQAAKGEGA